LRPFTVIGVVRLLRFVPLGLLFAAYALAEEPASALDTPAEAILPIAPAQPQPSLESQAVPKRLFGVIPNYRAEQFKADYQPLTTREKFAIAHSDSFDVPNYFLLVGYAVQSQIASGGFSHNGGLAGFAQSYSRSVGDQIIGSYVTEAIMPSLLHEDPRFFRLGTGTVWYRARNAASRIFVTRKDDGRNAFNISEVAGNAGVVALTTVYYADSRTASESFERFSMALGNDMVSNLLTEFWPDIKRRVPFHRHV
jgi:hypothetical protein